MSSHRRPRHELWRTSTSVKGCPTPAPENEGPAATLLEPQRHPLTVDVADPEAGDFRLREDPAPWASPPTAKCPFESSVTGWSWEAKIGASVPCLPQE